MAWEQRGKQRYYYRKVRVGKRVSSVYLGRDDFAEMLALGAEEKQFIADTEGALVRASRQLMLDINHQLGSEARLLDTILAALLQASGFHQHKGQWRLHMSKKKKITIKEPNIPLEELRRLQARMDQQREPDPQSVARFRQLAVDHPSLWPQIERVSQGMREHIVHLITDGRVRALMLSELDVLKKNLGYEVASGLEKLLIEHILTARVRLYWVEQGFNQNVCEGYHALAQGGWWDNLLTSAHNRFLRAVETLVRIRRYARNSPLFQLNITNAGGRQIIVSPADNQSVTPSLLQQQKLF